MTPKIRPLITDDERPQFDARYAEKSLQILSCTGTFLETIEQIRKRKVSEADTIWNAAFHVNVVAHDLHVLIYQMAIVDDIWAARTLARVMAVFVYEACEDIPVLFGKKYRDACASLGFLALVDDDLKACRKALVDFENLNRELIKKIRIVAGAHKDHDSFALVTTIAEINLGQMVDVGCVLDDVLKRYGAAGMRVIEECDKECKARGLI